MEAKLKYISLVTILLFVLSACKAKDPMVKMMVINEMTEKVDSRNYTFQALIAIPMGEKNIHLTSDYSLRVTPDTITAYLPYYGRVYSAVNSTDGGVKFVSTNFDYNVSEKKKGTSRVSIKVNDTLHNYKLSLLIGETGNCTLYVDQNNKQGITFTGDIH